MLREINMQATFEKRRARDERLVFSLLICIAEYEGNTFLVYLNIVRMIKGSIDTS